MDYTIFIFFQSYKCAAWRGLEKLVIRRKRAILSAGQGNGRWTKKDISRLLEKKEDSNLHLNIYFTINVH